MKTPHHDHLDQPTQSSDIEPSREEIQRAGEDAAAFAAEWVDATGLDKRASPQTVDSFIEFIRVAGEVSFEYGDELLKEEGILDIIVNRFAPHIQKKKRELVREAQRDEVTGLANRAAFNRAEEVAEKDPETKLLFIDANNFGKINKKISHAVGDSAIKNIAEHLETCTEKITGSKERIFRYGGDEFVVIVNKDVADELKELIVATYGKEVATDSEEIKSRGEYSTQQGVVGYLGYGDVQVSLSVGIGNNRQEADIDSSRFKVEFKHEVEGRRSLGKRALRRMGLTSN